MLLYISIYFLIAIILNILIDFIFDEVERRGVPITNEDRWDNFTKGLTLVLWPIVIIITIHLIFNKKEND